MENKNGHWIYPEIINPEEWFGFTYRIIEIDTQKEYIGRKYFWSKRRISKKDEKRNKYKISESDWKIYTGSCKILNEEIEKKGLENYIFEILNLYKTKGTTNYGEIETQVLLNVLRERFEDGTRKYYNGNIGNHYFAGHFLTDETREKISKTRKTKGSAVGEKNPMFGKKHTDEAKAKIAARDYSSISGDNNFWKNFEMTEEHRKKIGDRYYPAGEDNPRFGKPATGKNIKGGKHKSSKTKRRW